jgi:hypothetical protein
VGACARAGLCFGGDWPAQVAASLVVRRDDGRTWERSESLKLRSSDLKSPGL